MLRLSVLSLISHPSPDGVSCLFAVVLYWGGYVWACSARLSRTSSDDPKAGVPGLTEIAETGHTVDRTLLRPAHNDDAVSPRRTLGRFIRQVKATGPAVWGSRGSAGPTVGCSDSIGPQALLSPVRALSGDTIRTLERPRGHQAVAHRMKPCGSEFRICYREIPPEFRPQYESSMCSGHLSPDSRRLLARGVSGPLREMAGHACRRCDDRQTRSVLVPRGPDNWR